MQFIKSHFRYQVSKHASSFSLFPGVFRITFNDLPKYIFDGVCMDKCTLFSNFWKSKQVFLTTAFIVSDQFVCTTLGFSYCTYICITYPFLLVSATICYNSLSSRDYLDKREELRQAREERFVCHAFILPYPSLWLFVLPMFVTVELSYVYIFNSVCTKHFYSKRLL